MDTALNGDNALRMQNAFAASPQLIGGKTIAPATTGFNADQSQKLSPVLQNLADVAGKVEQPVVSGSGRIWGDPHFIGADGDIYDVQGEAGKTYNLLSDRSFQMNGRFDQWGTGSATVVGQVGITAGANYIDVAKNGTTIVNGKEVADGERVDLRDGGYVERKGSDVHVRKGEWEIDFQTYGDQIDLDVRSANANSDGVLPQGLLGQTFDGDGKALRGDEGSGAQGGGVLKAADGTLSKAGDKSTVKSYEVNALWDTTFKNHNMDYGQQSNIDKLMQIAGENMKMGSFNAAMKGFADTDWGTESAADEPAEGSKPAQSENPAQGPTLNARKGGLADEVALPFEPRLGGVVEPAIEPLDIRKGGLAELPEELVNARKGGLADDATLSFKPRLGGVVEPSLLDRTGRLNESSSA